VVDLSTKIGERMGLERADLVALRHAAELHDVGIVGIPGNLLAKKRRLSEQETEMVRKHPFLGSKMLEGVPGVDATRRAILEHHEHFDGPAIRTDCAPRTPQSWPGSSPLPSFTTPPFPPPAPGRPPGRRGAADGPGRIGHPLRSRGCGNIRESDSL